MSDHKCGEGDRSLLVFDVHEVSRGCKALSNIKRYHLLSCAQGLRRRELSLNATLSNTASVFSAKLGGWKLGSVRVRGRE